MPSLQFVFDILLILFTSFSIVVAYVLKVVGHQLGDETVRGGLKLYTGGEYYVAQLLAW
jgi:hypothetical protein